MTCMHGDRAEHFSVPIGSLPQDAVRRVIEEVMKPGNFFATAKLHVRWLHEYEEILWELFRGRVLDRAQTRLRRRFETWSLREVNSEVADDEPILSVRLDAQAGEIHVTRSILVYAWEAYADTQGAIQSRETVKRNRELVGSLLTEQYSSAEQLQADLSELLFLAVVGTSRLPLTSEESPHPAFTFGQWMYCYRPPAGEVPISDPCEWIASSLRPELGWREKGRLLEFAIRAGATEDIGKISEVWRSHWLTMGHSRDDLLRTFRTVFEEISLSPYTDFVTNFLAVVKTLLQIQFISPADEVDFLSFQLRLLWRHLNAYDLIHFHHRGANYPDALLLDELLRRLFELAAAGPELFLSRAGDTDSESKTKRLRRRGLRLGWFVRCHYAGLAVPELPTSPGENSRVLPEPYRRLREEEILNPAKRSRHLFDAELRFSDSVRRILSQCVADLNDARETQELGTALFLDRPFGFGKGPSEPDRTPLLSYVAFSRKLARVRLGQLARCFGLDEVHLNLDLLNRRLESAEYSIGVWRRSAIPMQRAGVACLEDALQVADDFAFLRTTRRSLQDFLDWFDLSPLGARGLSQFLSPGKCLLLRDEQRPDQLWVYDDSWQKRLLLRVDMSGGFVRQPRVELPGNGLEVHPAGDESNSVVPASLPLKRAIRGTPISH